jgi:hypothetical protein
MEKVIWLSFRFAFFLGEIAADADFQFQLWKWNKKWNSGDEEKKKFVKFCCDCTATFGWASRIGAEHWSESERLRLFPFRARWCCLGNDFRWFEAFKSSSWESFPC